MTVYDVPLANAGNFVVELYDRHAPRTCENFTGLARRRYYDGTKIHRIIKVHAALSNGLYTQH